MRSRRLRKARENPVVKLALTIVPGEQARRGDLRLADVSNHSDEDQRHMVRSGERRTIRRQSHIEQLRHKLDLEDREAAACQWYADTHAARYETLGIIGNYGEGSKSGAANFDHLPKNDVQSTAADQFDFARSAICPTLRPMFERVVIHGWDVSPGITMLFRLAARQVMHRIEGMVEL